MSLQLEEEEVHTYIRHHGVNMDTIHIDDKELNVDHHLSLQALQGGMGLYTIRFKGLLHGFPISIFVDRGISDNFLQPQISSFLKLHIEPISSFQVMVGNGNYIVVEGCINDLCIQVQASQFQLHVFLLLLCSAHLICGASWLKSIEPHLADNDSLHLKFLHDGNFTTLQSEMDMLSTQTQSHHIRRMMALDVITKIFNRHLT